MKKMRCSRKWKVDMIFMCNIAQEAGLSASYDRRTIAMEFDGEMMGIYIPLPVTKTVLRASMG
jgi:hypothetical protein